MSREEIRVDRGSHETPDAGSCLMEHVSLLAGEPFGPRPRCTHPALAVLAVLVNDRVSDAARVDLARRATALTRAHSSDPALTWRLVELGARTVLAHRPDDRPAGARLRRAGRVLRTRSRLLPPPVAARLPRWAAHAVALAALDELVAAVHAVLAVCDPVTGDPVTDASRGPDRDRVLVGLLDAAITVTTAGTTAPAPTEEFAR